MLRSGRAGSTSLGIVLCRDACPRQGRVALWSSGDSAPNKKDPAPRCNAAQGPPASLVLSHQPRCREPVWSPARSSGPQIPSDTIPKALLRHGSRRRAAIPQASSVAFRDKKRITCPSQGKLEWNRDTRESTRLRKSRTKTGFSVPLQEQSLTLDRLSVDDQHTLDTSSDHITPLVFRQISCAGDDHAHSKDVWHVKSTRHGKLADDRAAKGKVFTLS